MTPTETNYFVCTLGEAAYPGVSRPYSDVNQLIQVQAECNPDVPAIGFYIVSEHNEQTSFQPKVLTFKNVHSGTDATASFLVQQLQLDAGATVGLLAASSPEFFFTWLACIRLRCPVLLIAPQCSPSAIASLCKSCEVSVLLADEKHAELARAACATTSGSEGPKLTYRPLPFAEGSSAFDAISRRGHDDIPELAVKDDDIAYLHHTSGTSSGIPKAIPQSHHGAVGVLPALDGQSEATFTTTPLYHGGPADIFRAWSSSAMIWLFPSKDVPVTAKNVCSCLQAAATASLEGIVAPPKYFTSVPYILQMMATDEQGLQWLQKMILVGVGGAALPVEVGDRLVQQEVNLVSRFGAAECGFLLSSHRDYESDKDWQFLRLNEKVKQIVFEPRDGGLHELVIQADWPHMAKRNRDDGSYATSDLFERHSTIDNAWKYHSRADSQLTLITGKKFDPAPLEDSIVAASKLVADVLLFGNGQPYPGGLLFRLEQAKEATDEEVVSEIAPIVEKLNAESQTHARVPRNMLIPMPYVGEPLEKSSKGTVLRGRAEERYAKEINSAYKRIVPASGREVHDKDVQAVVHDLVKSITAPDEDQGLDVNADLFSMGVDSVACVQIRHGLSQYLPKDAAALPLTIVEDSRTISTLADLVVRLRHRGTVDLKPDSSAQIPELVEKYSQLVEKQMNTETTINGTSNTNLHPATILLTGPTGLLGSHVLSYLLTLSTAQIRHVYLLIRGATPEAARERVLKALSSRQLSVPSDFDERVTVLQCKLSEHCFGLNQSDYDRLRKEVDVAMHLAWSVNFLLSLGSFSPHFVGIQNLLNFAMSSTKSTSPKIIFCSSVASVSSFETSDASHTIPEDIVADTSAAGSTGYAQSKLTAELILSRAATTSSCLRNNITIVRVGQLSADTKHGVWNKSEAYPQILASAKFIDRTLPDLGSEEKLTWLPVDIAAQAFVEASLRDDEDKMGIRIVPTEHVKQKLGEKPNTMTMLKMHNGQGLKIDQGAVRVLHLLNPDTVYTFTDLVEKLQAVNRKEHANKAHLGMDHDVKIVTAKEWLEKLESLQQQHQDSSLPKGKNTDSESQSKNEHFPTIQSLFRLLPFWKQVYTDRQPSQSNPTLSVATNRPESSFAVHYSLLAMPSLTSWLGLSTVEGRKAAVSAAGAEARASSLGAGGEGNGGEVREDRALVNGVDGASEGRGVRAEELVEDAGHELLRDEYVRKVWKWVWENVP